MRLEFFWDVASPYTYLASTQLPGLIARTNVEVTYRPFLLGGVFRSAGIVMPGANPVKAGYMMKDLARWRDHYGVAMRMPVQDVVFPVNSILPMRVACGVEEAHAEPYLHAIMKAYWVDGNDPSAPETVRSVLTSIGADADAILERATTPEVKDRLRENSDEAVSRGAFGAPSMFLGEDLYFGNDRLEMVERRLRTA